MRLDTFLIADGVSTPPDGKIYVHGGGVTRFNVSKLPFSVPQISILARLDVTPEERDAEHRFELAWYDPQDALLGPPIIFEGGADPSAPALPDDGEETFLTLALNVHNLTFGLPGLHRLVLTVDGKTLRTLRFPVSLMPAAHPEDAPQPETPANHAE